MTWLLARYTFLNIARSKSFLISVFGMPFLLAVWIFGSALLGLLVVDSLKEKLEVPVAILDESGVLIENEELLGGLETGQKRTLKIPEDLKKKRDKEKRVKQEGQPRSRADFVKDEMDDPALTEVVVYSVRSVEEGRALLEKERVEIFLHYPRELEEDGKYVLYTRPNKGVADLSSRVSLILKDELLRRKGFATELRQAFLYGFDSKIVELKKSGSYSESEDRELGEFAYYLILAIALVLPMGAAANYGISSGLSGESELHLRDVLLSSISVRELILGKVLGGSAADILTITVWGVVVVSLAALGLGLERGIFLLMEQPRVFLAFFFALIGIVQFHLFGAFLGSFASSGSQNKLIQWAARLLGLFPVVGVIFGTLNPEGSVVEVLSFVPMISPATMVARLVMSEVSLLQTILAFLINLGFFVITVSLLAKLYRVVMVSKGGRISRAVFKQLLQTS